MVFEHSAAALPWPMLVFLMVSRVFNVFLQLFKCVLIVLMVRGFGKVVFQVLSSL